MTADQLYEKEIKQFSAIERLHIITRIINDIFPQEIVDYSDEWSDEDLRDVSAHSLRRAALSFGEV